MVPLVKAVQEQQQIIENLLLQERILNEENIKMNTRLKLLEDKMEELLKALDHKKK